VRRNVIPHPSSRRERGRGEATRETILARALEMTSLGGLESLTIGLLASAVGLSKSGLFAHFGSKEDLEVAVMKAAARRFIAEVVTPALAEPRGEPRLRALFDRWMEWEHADGLPGGCPFLAVASELDDRPGPVRELVVQTQRDWLDSLASAARVAVREGQFRSDVDAEQLAYEIYSLLLGYHLFGRLLADPAVTRRAHAAFDTLIACSRP
jgi:AcrR family transcriptional regulator